MNRFLTKRKPKQAKPEPKFELDLTTALPSSNDFRTSLLMPNLSARFSMLREQDDPNSLIGKASDDSVLAPKRQSRLYEFGFKPTGLSDIAEVASISSASFKPPFASERSNSYSSDAGYNTDGELDSGGMMSRARPGEGNVLFGGRQKITRIAGDGKGRTLYDDDVATSTFQKWRAEERQREREAAMAKESRKYSFDEEGKSPSKYAMSVSGSLKRQTSSSTSTSGLDSRSSTAATSINSQGHASNALASFNFGPSVTNAPPLSPTASNMPSLPQQPSSTPTLPNVAPSPMGVDRNMTKRRLYDNGLDREMQDQQNTAMNRLHSVNKRPGMGGRAGPEMWQGRERAMRNGAPPVRSTSPSPAALERRPTLNGLPGKDVKIGRSNTGKFSPAVPSSPMAPQTEPQGMLASSLNPNDRGKATAMGVFNKPRQFNEQQFMERQATLQKDKGSPAPSTAGFTPIAEVPREPEVLKIPQDVTRIPASLPTPPPEQHNSSPTESSIRKPSLPAWNQSSSTSNGPFSRSRSASGNEKDDAPAAPTGFSVFQRAANQMKANTLDADNKEIAVAGNKFNFVDDSDSDYEEDRPKPLLTARNGRLPPNTRIPGDAPLVPPPQHEHPAFRNTPQPSREDLRSDFRQTVVETAPPSNLDPVDSPTLPNGNGAGLSGMIRQHLRNNSDMSRYSVATNAGMPTPVPAFPTELQAKNLDYLNGSQQSAGVANTAHSSYAQSNPWDLEDLNGSYNRTSRDPVSPLGDDEKRESRNAAQQQNGSRQNSHTESSWQQEMNKKTHNRGGSTETQQEREALANELAQRQKAIQEKLRERAESDMRSTSPTPGKSAPFMGVLRQKASFDTYRSRDNSRTRDEPRQRAPDKALRMLGMNGSCASLANGSPTLGGSADRPSWDGESRPHAPRSIPMQVPRPSKEFQHPAYGQSGGNRSGSRPSTGRDSSDDQMRPRANSNAVSSRSRSNSEHSNGRSRSRNGRYNDMMNSGADHNGLRGAFGGEATIPEHLPPQLPAPEHPVPDVPESPSHGNAFKQFKTIDASTFEQKGLWPPPQNPVVHPLGAPSPRSSPGLSPAPALNGHLPSPGMHTNSNRPSPGFGPSHSPMLPNSGRGTPLTPAFANPTPPLSANHTPIVPSFSASTPNLAGLNAPKSSRPRKMSVKKSDISDPVLISTTSVVDTVALPAGASLRNGMDAPPLPPFNPRRKRFGFGRSDTDPPEPPYMSPPFGSQSSDEREKPRMPRHRLKKSSSDGAKIGLYVRAQQESAMVAATQSTPALQHLQTSPPRMQNGMF